MSEKEQVDSILKTLEKKICGKCIFDGVCSHLNNDNRDNICEVAIKHSNN